MVALSFMTTCAHRFLGMAASHASILIHYRMTRQNPWKSLLIYAASHPRLSATYPLQLSRAAHQSLVDRAQALATFMLKITLTLILTLTLVLIHTYTCTPS